ncbi:ARC6/PARC6 family protein [Aeromicrobium sp. Leaf350]|uniref:ARC6/PARC6 family protein n=1 Tax=Aeromicrobium sp. Leaf350 TaxID=2876565 RepID=UPI001E3649C2|nr:ARC6/PARC6 family protein [Aeromicrobium sp. Leaf350]
MPSPVPPPPPARDRGRVGLVVAVVALAIVLVAGGVTTLVLVLGGSSGTSDFGTPEEATRGYIEATNDGDCEAMAVHPVSGFDSTSECEDFRQEAKENDEDEAEVDLNSFVIDELEVTSESDDEATVHLESSIDITVDGETTIGHSSVDYTVSHGDEGWIVTDLEPDYGDDGTDEDSDQDDSDRDDSDRDDDAAEAVEDAVREFTQATTDLDCTILAEHPVTEFGSVQECEEELADAMEEAETSGIDVESFVIEIDDLEVVSVDDDTATVRLDVTQTYDIDGDEQSASTTVEYELEKDGDEWRVVRDVTEISDPVGPDGA